MWVNYYYRPYEGVYSAGIPRNSRLSCIAVYEENKACGDSRILVGRYKVKAK